MNSPIEILLIVLLVGHVLVRRMLGEPAEAKRMLVLPLVLAGIGVSDVVHTSQSTAALGVLIGSVAVGVVLGLLRGLTVRTYAKDGIVFMRYTGATIALWVLNVVAKVVIALVAQASGSSGVPASHGLMLSLGAGILAEGCVVMVKALRSDGQVIWAKGKDGRPHSTSDALDSLQRSLRDRLADRR